jgi:short subunit dehydrogenase-like uncharacterized protein
LFISLFVECLVPGLLRELEGDRLVVAVDPGKVAHRVWLADRERGLVGEPVSVPRDRRFRSSARAARPGRRGGRRRASVGSAMVNDIVVFGATGFVGRLVAGYLAVHAPQHARIALAGRSREKLERVRAELGRAAAAWPLVVADSSDPDSLRAMAEATKVVATTVGPYRDGGIALVDACIAAGTSYLDLTGEVLFTHESVQRHDAAKAKGVRVVHSCGFDSIPSDLGVLLLHQAVGELGDTTLIVAAMKGGFSGGTLASMKGQVDELKTDKAKRRIVFDPYALTPGAARSQESDLRKVVRHPRYGWIGPFVMATYNTRIVRRSHHLLDYGPGFRYREVSRYKSPVSAVGFTAGLGALAGGLAFAPTRKVLDKVLPEPGQGPGEKARRSGFFRMEIHGQDHVATVAAKGDPGYAATAVMMGESALALALDGDRLPPHTGVLTPASALGVPLIERLRTTGMTFDVNVNSR